jgi:RNA polymerase sigma-70 factor (ECF subfamily)
MNPRPQLARRPASDDHALVAGLRAGDRRAFETLIERHHASMLRVASLFVRDRAVADEVAQETWLAVLEGIDRFEERSSLKTWIFRILTNRAKTRAQREGRSVPLSALRPPAGEPAVDADRFLGGAPEPGAWASPPRDWETIPEERLLSQETLGLVARAIEELPAAQREVIRLRDVDGWTAEEVCDVLGITDGNQRVLLHRARSKVRQALEDYLEEAA